jgi:hypothetical protein
MAGGIVLMGKPYVIAVDELAAFMNVGWPGAD